jgi:hypothetical protein
MSTATGAVPTTDTSGTTTPSEPSTDTAGDDEGFVTRVRNADDLGEAVDVGLDKTSELTGRFRANGPIAAFFQSPEEHDSLTTHAGFRRQIQMIGGAVITAFMIVVVLSMLWQLDIIGSGNGPFAELFDKYVTYGVAALSVVGIAIIIFAANLAINAFGGMGGDGGRGGGR